MRKQAHAESSNATLGKVYCPICTHTVEAELERGENRIQVRPGQKCPRCAGSLDAGYIFRDAVFRNSRAA